MAVGMLIFLQGNQWVARVTNSMTGLNCSGATTSAQWQNVKSLANAMKGEILRPGSWRRRSSVTKSLKRPRLCWHYCNKPKLHPLGARHETS